MYSVKRVVSLPLILATAATALVLVPVQTVTAGDHGKGSFIHVKDSHHQGRHSSGHKSHGHKGYGHRKHHRTRNHHKHRSNNHNKHHANSGGHHNNRHRNHKRARHYNYGYGSNYGYGYGNHYTPSYSFSYTPRTYSSHNSYQSSGSEYAGNNCRSTYKYVTDSYGNQTKVNGTMCYDRYGKPYIVPGSRSVASSSYN